MTPTDYFCLGFCLGVAAILVVQLIYMLFMFMIFRRFEKTVEDHLNN